MNTLSDIIEVDYGTVILEELTGEQSLTHKGQRVRLFDQSGKTAEAYYPADERGKPYIHDFQQGKRYYPVTAYSQAHNLDWTTALQQLKERFIGDVFHVEDRHRVGVRTSIAVKPKPPVSYHEPAIVTQTLERYADNYLAIYLRRLLGVPIANELLQRFHVGTWGGGFATEWKHTTVYWQIDESSRVRCGKVILYNQVTGKRIKDKRSDFNAPTWVHKLLCLPDFNYEQCLFGLHQIANEPFDKPIAIVESEKSAIICTAFDPGFIWMACGGLSNLIPDRFKQLKNRVIVLFPDLGAFPAWSTKAELLTKLGYRVTVSSILERKGRAAVLQRADKEDLADFLTRYRCPETGRVLNAPDGYPSLWDTPNPINSKQIPY